MIEPAVDVSLILPPLINEAHTSEVQIAAALDVHPLTVHGWCTRARFASASVIEVLAAHFGLTVNEFMDGEPAKRTYQSAITWVTGARPAARVKPPNLEQLRRERLLGAGMVRLQDVRPPSYELYCLCCGRGTGADGVLRTTRILPRSATCRFCDGRMLAREIMSGWMERQFHLLAESTYESETFAA